jgi:hypothetical protein
MMQTVLLPTASDDATQYVMPIPELVIYNRGAHKSVIASPSFVVQHVLLLRIFYYTKRSNEFVFQCIL